MISRLRRRLPGRLPGLLLLRSSPYRFSLEDGWLFLCETRLHRPRMRAREAEGEWLWIDVGGVQVAWPSSLDPGELPWLHQEVFLPAAVNPHAYEAGSVRIHAGDWVVDGGAGEGFFTHYALRRGASVLAVEPSEPAIAGLERTFAGELRQGRLVVLHAALGDASGTGLLDLSPLHSAETVVGEVGHFSVPIVTLDGLLQEGVVPRIDFLKMDIEGAELAALRGAEAVLRSQRPKLSVAVYHDLDNARLAASQVSAVEPRYQLSFRGLWASEGCVPRPHLLLGSYDEFTEMVPQGSRLTK